MAKKSAATKKTFGTDLILKYEIRAGPPGAARWRWSRVSRFSWAYGISKRALQEWAQGGRQPDSTARAYLTVIAKEPVVVRRALGWTI